MDCVGLDGWTNGDLERLFAGLGSLESLDFGELIHNNGRNEGGVAYGEEDVATRLHCLGSLRKLRRLKLTCNASVTPEVGSE